MINLAVNYPHGYDIDMWTETIDGKIYAMSPRPGVKHHDVADKIYTIFKRYLKGKPCRAFGDGVLVFLTPQEKYVPDAMIVCNKDIIKDRGVYGAPDLVVEILSSRTAKLDRTHKKDIYEKFGVKEYWLVDIASKSIEVYWLVDGKFVINNYYAVHPDYILEDMTEEEKAATVYEFTTSLFNDFVVDIREVFEDIE